MAVFAPRVADRTFVREHQGSEPRHWAKICFVLPMRFALASPIDSCRDGLVPFSSSLSQSHLHDVQASVHRGRGECGVVQFLIGFGYATRAQHPSAIQANAARAAREALELEAENFRPTSTISPKAPAPGAQHKPERLRDAADLAEVSETYAIRRAPARVASRRADSRDTPALARRLSPRMPRPQRAARSPGSKLTESRAQRASIAAPRAR